MALIDAVSEANLVGKKKAPSGAFFLIEELSLQTAGYDRHDHC
jgi:hypothetical protein